MIVGEDCLNASNHRRFNPLTGEWVLVTPGRLKRPWQGSISKKVAMEKRAYDKDCYLCPANTRISGVKNPDYKGVYIFDNDTPSLSNKDFAHLAEKESEKSLFQVKNARGTCRVVCFSERHDLTFADLSQLGALKVVEALCRESKALSEAYRCVQIFENKGEMMGCSNPHPHAQIWACDFVPTMIQKEDETQKAYFDQHKVPLLLEALRLEKEQKKRMVYENEHFAVFVPFWAKWPFETMLVPKRSVTYLKCLETAERQSLALAMKKIVKAYDGIFATSFPYSMGFHEPCHAEENKEYFQLHAHYYPPLLRSDSIKKHMVGFEMLAEESRDMTPERAAETIRSFCL